MPTSKIKIDDTTVELTTINHIGKTTGRVFVANPIFGLFQFTWTVNSSIEDFIINRCDPCYFASKLTHEMICFSPKATISKLMRNLKRFCFTDFNEEKFASLYVELEECLSESLSNLNKSDAFFELTNVPITFSTDSVDFKNLCKFKFLFNKFILENLFGLLVDDYSEDYVFLRALFPRIVSELKEQAQPVLLKQQL